MTTPPSHSQADSKLTPESQAEIDRLLQHGLDPAELSVSTSPAARLLCLLSSPLATEDPSLIDITCLRAQRATEYFQPEGLCPADEEAFEALVRAEYSLDRVPKSLRARAERLLTLQQAVTTPLASDLDPSLISRTLAHVQAELDTQSHAMEFDRRRGLSGLRLADVISVAAVMLIASSILVPVFSAMRSQATRTACETNMRLTANAMGLYAGEYDGSLPVQAAGFGGSWMQVGEPQMSNSANLFTLVRTNHARLNDLACPGNRAAPTARIDPEQADWDKLEEVSYSYQIVTSFHPDWNSDANARSPVILADRSPVILRAAAGELINPWESSPNHNRQGQHVLRTDGSSEWRRDAWPAGEDNIWLPRFLEVAIDEARTKIGLTGTELPDDPSDTFLGP